MTDQDIIKDLLEIYKDVLKYIKKPKNHFSWENIYFAINVYVGVPMNATHKYSTINPQQKKNVYNISCQCLSYLKFQSMLKTASVIPKE